ncbi:MAG: electron transfer flavoprotein subunit alpha/FixB family protein, partial [Planctomycetes bacterium]|nr:electron transfer flavoprotein subunit alpha/FixB family protein [Planctomycetota bacterium]
MSNVILAFAEQRNGTLRKTAFEVVTAAADVAGAMNGEVVAVLIGSGIESLAQQLGAYGASKVLIFENDCFKNYTGESFCAAFNHAFQSINPCAALLPASAMGKDLAPRVAAMAGS